MRAHAHLAVTADHGLATRIQRLRSDPPLVLRPTLDTAPNLSVLVGPGGAHVSLAAAAAGPLGGDHLRLDVDIGAGATLGLRTVAATLALPGPHARPSRSETTFRVGPGATLVWLPEPTIAARNCDHSSVTRIHLDEGARLVSREELLLGRHGEQPGTIRQRLRVTLGAHPLHDQELHIDDDTPAWRGAAVTGNRKALGNLLLTGPTRDWSALTGDADAQVSVLRLDATAVLVTALAHNAHTLRHVLDRHLRAAAPGE